jgi:hypothetical protein
VFNIMDGIDQNAGIAGDGSQGNYSDTGDLGGNQPSSLSQQPNGQDGQPTDTRDAELARMRDEVKRLNQHIVESRRNQRQPQGQEPQNEGYDAFSDPAGQYSIALQVATGNLRAKLEDVVSLYPELTPTEVARIRKNPWAFASQDAFINGDVDTALLEIEQAMLERADEITAEQKTQPEAPRAAQVPANPAPEPEMETEPGTEEDEDPWTMPLTKLKAKKDQAVKQLKGTS